MSESRPPSQPPSAASRQFILIVVAAAALATAVLVTTAVLIGYSAWKAPEPGESKAAAPSIAAALLGNSEWNEAQPNMERLSTKVVELMNDSLKQDAQFRDAGIQVRSMTVMRSDGTLIEGQAAVATRDGTEHAVAVHINYDGVRLMWRTDPGTFAFVA